MKTLPALTETEEKPVPTDAFQSCFGPSFGHAVDQPVSLEMPFKSGPRQRYQSVAEAAADTLIKAPTASQRDLRFRRPLFNAEDAEVFAEGAEQMLAFLCAALCSAIA